MNEFGKDSLEVCMLGKRREKWGFLVCFIKKTKHEEF